jgi:hypothetical protein
MPEIYPIPSYAVNLWVAGDDLWLAFPGQGPEGRGHSIRLPASEHGLKTAVKILRDRAQAERLEIGNDGTPTQYTVEQHAGRAWGTVSKRMREEREARTIADEMEAQHAKAAKAKRLAKDRAEAARELQELGL